MDSGAGEIAIAFVNARRTGAAISEYPGVPPEDLETAYTIQDRALSLWERPVGGWKVGKINPPASDMLGANRLIGPVFADIIKRDGIEDHQFRIFAGGFAAVEAEFMLRLSPQDGPLPSSPSEAMAWVDEVRIGLEIASSPYSRINDDGPCVTVSDHGNNAGLLLGSVVPESLWNQLDDITVSLAIDGREAGRATTRTMLDGPFGAVCFLLQNLAGRDIALEAGWWVSSGAITGVHQVSEGETAVANFDGLGKIETRIASAD